MRTVSALAILLCLVGRVSADGNRLAYLDHLDPYYVSTSFPKLITPQWVGEEGVDCVIVLAIDDMRDVSKYERYLRPILDRLKKIDGRAPVSIMTNSVDPEDTATRSQLKSWLEEGLSIEVHTVDHPCPLLCDGDFSKAKSTYDRCVDLVDDIPNNRAVAFRMPCCDSLNTPSPRFWNEIFENTTPQGKHLSIDSSVFCITNGADPEVKRQQAFDADGREKFQKYLPFPSFVNTIQNYPYPYVVGRTCWEFPCIVPSDWEAQNLHQPNNPQTVDDMKTALDVVVQKKGTYNLVFHPHGWIRAEQIVALIDHAISKYGNRVKFLTFRECDERIREHLLQGHSLRSAVDRSGSSISNIRILDLDNDGYQDVIRLDSGRGKLHSRVWQPASKEWLDSSANFDGALPTFGILSDSNFASLVYVSAANQQLTALTYHRDGNWTQSNITRGTGSTRSPAISDIRLRDLDQDGICEIIVGRAEQNQVLRFVSADRWVDAGFKLPENIAIDSKSHDALRFVDIDQDGDLDCLYSDAGNCSLHLFASIDSGWSDQVFADTRREGGATLPPFMRSDGTNNGAWIHSGYIWYQNEDTSRLPDKVDRRKLSKLLDRTTSDDNASVFPPPRSPEETLASISTSPDVAVELVAAEPLIQDPVAFDWDVDGSLWVAEMRDYPNGMDGKGAPGGRVKHLVDTDRDGTFDKATLFLDDLPFPTGVKVWRDGILITSAPNILLAKDSDGDGRADTTQILYSGFGEGNQQHRVNGLTWGMDGWLYVANGDSGGSIVSTATNKRVEIGGRDLRINPDNGDVEAIAGQTQFGRCVDEHGNWFGGNNSSPIWHYGQDDRYVSRNPHFSALGARRQIQVQPGASPVFPTSKLLPRFNDYHRANRFTSACSPVIYRDELLPASDANYFFVCEPVHNLVHRESVTPDGLSFRANRLPFESASEVFASSDNWSRPVMARTGPDGCVWIADMYRLVIEHPTWIPTDWQKQVDVRSGDDMGRIYRIVPSDAKRRNAAENRNKEFDISLNRLSTSALVKRLAHRNGWHRDMAQQLLLWRNDANTASLLTEMIGSTPNAMGKIYGMHTLRLLDGLTPAVILRCIDDPNDDVARHAIRNAEALLNSNESAGNAICRRIDATPTLHPIHQQAAYTLGEWNHSESGRHLARLAHRFDDNYLMAAIVSSLSKRNIRAALDETHTQITKAPGQIANPSFVAELLRQSVIHCDTQIIQLAASVFTDAQYKSDAAWQFDTYRQMKLALERRESSTSKLGDSLLIIQTMLIGQATSIASNVSRSVPERVAAIALLADNPTSSEIKWEELLTPQHPHEINVAAVNAMLQEPDGASELLQTWPQISPRLRSHVLDRLLNSPNTTLQVLRAIQRKDLLASDLGIVRQHQIRRHSDDRIQELADQLYGSSVNAERESVVAQYERTTAGRIGNSTRGAVIFKKYCATCHRLGNAGNEVGPNLAALSDKSPRSLLTAILDPNRSVEERYVSYNIQTRDGLLLSGAMAEESATSVSIVGVDGKLKTILRNQIETVQSSGLSVMPVGFEKEVSPAEASDLIAFLQNHTAPRKEFPGNEPRIAPVRNDGSIRLFAVHANIFGPNLVFEERCRNLGFWSSNHDRAVWQLEVPTAGEYNVRIEYACEATTAGNRFLLTIGDQAISANVESTGTWDRYSWRSLGKIKLPAGSTTAVLRSAGPITSYLMDYRTIVLDPE